MGPFTRWLISKAVSRFAVHELSAFTDGSYEEAGGGAHSPVSILRLQIRYLVTRSGFQPDIFENVLHFVNTVGELPGAEATDTQKMAVEAGFTAFWNSIKSKAPSTVRLEEYRWYHLLFGDPLSGPPTRVATGLANAASNASNFVPAQTATTVTLRTALRKHWGRIYLPWADVSSGGLITNANVDLITANFKVFMNSCHATGLELAVYSPTTESLMSVYQLEADNVPDIVRRRRPKISTYRSIITS